MLTASLCELTGSKPRTRRCWPVLAARARVSALTELGIRDEMGQLDALNAQKAALERDIDAAEALVYDRIQHVEHVRYHTRPERIKQIIRTGPEAHRGRPDRSHAAGAADRRADAEKSRLEETVWAATSPRQVSDIFQALNTLLDDRPTALEQAAHALQHPED